MAKPKAHGLGAELTEMAKRVASMEDALAKTTQSEVRLGTWLDVAVEVLVVLIPHIEERGGYTKGSPVDGMIRHGQRVIDFRLKGEDR